MPDQNSLEQIVLSILKQHGFDKLAPEYQEAYLMQFTAEAERRLGIAVAPFMDEKAAKEFAKTLKTDATAEDWYKFWKKYVPNFEKLMQDTMVDFSKEVANAFKI